VDKVQTRVGADRLQYTSLSVARFNYGQGKLLGTSNMPRRPPQVDRKFCARDRKRIDARIVTRIRYTYTFRRHIICKRDFYNRMSNNSNTICSSRILAVAVASNLYIIINECIFDILKELANISHRIRHTPR